MRTIVLTVLLAAPPAIFLAPSSAAPEPFLPGDGPFTLLALGRELVGMVDADLTPVRTWPVPGGNIHDVELMPNGHLLVTLGGYTGLVPETAHVPYNWVAPAVAEPAGSMVVELDATGAPVWWLTHAGGVLLTWTHDADYLEATDTFLLADTTVTKEYADRVIEVDRAGNVLWSYVPAEDEYPNDADRLPGGNTLVSLRNANRIDEVAPDGTVVWSFGKKSGPLDGLHNPDRLPNGNTIVADSNHNRIGEVDRAGNVVWTFGGSGVLNWPRDADVLPNGNVLVTDSHNQRTIEVTRAGEITWEIKNTAALFLNYDSDRVNLPPVIAIASPAAGAKVANPVTFDVSATDASLASATTRLSDETLGAYVDPAPVPLPSSAWTRAIASGHSYRLDVAATDAAGEGGGFPQDDSVVETSSSSVKFQVG